MYQCLSIPHLHSLVPSNLDPDFVEYDAAKGGKEVKDGVTRKVAFFYNGAPISIDCGSNDEAVVEQATRIVYQCKQFLAPYIRYPCLSKGPCTVDYNKEWYVLGV